MKATLNKIRNKKNIISLAVACFLCSTATTNIYASDIINNTEDNIEILISEADETIQIIEIDKSVFGVQIDLPIISGLTDNITYTIENPDFSGFLHTKSNMLSIYMANDSDMKTDTTIDIGVLENIADLTFAETGSILITNFLYQEESFENIPITVIKDTANDDNSSDEENEDENSSGGNGTTGGSSSGGSSSGGSSGGGSSSSNNSTTTDTTTNTEDTQTTDKEDSQTEDKIFDVNVILAEYADIDVHWARENIAFVVDEGLFAGTGYDENDKRIFSPDEQMTRAMFVTVLSRMQDVPLAFETGIFEDVPADAWYTTAVNWAVDYKITSGTAPTLFSPDANITREQMAVFLYNYMNAFHIHLDLIEDAETFVDDDEISDYARTAISIMQQADVINGRGEGIFDPKGLATRAEVATLITRFVRAIKEVTVII